MLSLQAIAQKYIDMLPLSPRGLTMPMPKFVLANQLSARWNGLAILNFDGTCTVKIQKRIMGDENSLNRIVAHEICHAWAYFMVGIGQQAVHWCRGHSSTGGWHRAAQVINQHEGADFVSEFSDETYVERNEKKFWVYLERNSRGLFWAWFSRVTTSLEQSLHARIFEANARNMAASIFKTDDVRFLLPGAKLPNTARLREMPDDLIEKLDRILREHPLTEDSPHDIRTLLSQAKVARLERPRRPIRFSR